MAASPWRSRWRRRWTPRSTSSLSASWASPSSPSSPWARSARTRCWSSTTRSCAGPGSPTTSLRQSKNANATGSTGELDATRPIEPASPSAVGPRSWSTMASPLDQQHGPPAGWPGLGAPPARCWRCQLDHQARPLSYARAPTRWCASRGADPRPAAQPHTRDKSRPGDSTLTAPRLRQRLPQCRLPASRRWGRTDPAPRVRATW